MQITQHPAADWLELRISGRIDATWGDHLGSTIENAVRGGSHRIVLNFAQVDYISSLGISVLFAQYRLLNSVKGSLAISNPTRMCRTVLTTVGLAGIFVDDLQEPARPAGKPVPVKRTIGNGIYETYPQTAGEPLACRLIGEPELLKTTGYDAGHWRSLGFADGSFGLGLGAFGQGFEDCRDRFGEFLAAAGCAIALPTNEPRALPDYVIEQSGLVPQVETLYAIAGIGEFASMVRFDAAADGAGKIALSEFTGALLDLSAADPIAFVVLAESDCLVGATLRRSPGEAPLAHDLPQVRDWLSFTTERAGAKELCLLVGVAGRSWPAEAASFLRPIRAGSTVLAHIHAAVFPYRPVERGELPLASTVAGVLAASAPRALLHLMADTRRFEGVGESELARGACWMGPLTTVGRG